MFGLPPAPCAHVVPDESAVAAVAARISRRVSAEDFATESLVSVRFYTTSPFSRELCQPHGRPGNRWITTVPVASILCRRPHPHAPRPSHPPDPHLAGLGGDATKFTRSTTGSRLHHGACGRQLVPSRSIGCGSCADA